MREIFGSHPQEGVLVISHDFWQVALLPLCVQFTVIGNMPQMRKITFDATICNVKEYAWNEKDYFRSYNLQSQGSGSG